MVGGGGGDDGGGGGGGGFLPMPRNLCTQVSLYILLVCV